ncbi:MAG: geranylgeranyl reductase family protein [Candidatus Micrarchaeota archaeon]|nr:geranylgeranyl reductase family protein [Candidatus Micrarchaeota archaeon]
MTQEILYDAIVVGGGPAGSTAATFLAKKGRRVLLLEKENWPRNKTCGDAISGKSVGVLRELGLTDALEKAEHGEVVGITFSSPNGTVVTIPFKGSDGQISKGYVCRRMVYDNILWDNAKRLCDSYEGVEVTGLVKEGQKVIGVRARDKAKQEMEFRAKIVIGADGVASVVARETRGADVDPQHTCIAYRAYYSGISGMNSTLEIHFVKSILPGYFWIFPLEHGIANVGVGMVMSDMKKGNVNLQKAMLDIINNNPLFKSRFANAKQLSPISAWSLPFGSKKRKVSGDGFLLVGDAAGLVDPFSGEGIGNAMTSGKIAAEVADEALSFGRTDAEMLAKYDQKLWAEIENELKLSYAMQKLGKIEWLLNFVISKAAKSPKAREAIAGTFTNEEAKKEYISPLFYLKLLFS